MTFADSEKLSFPFIYFEAWLSLVERCVRDAEVVGSNPVASTNKKPEIPQGISGFAAEGVVAARPVDARSATTGAENESRRLDCRKPRKIEGFRYFFAHFFDDIWSRVVNDLQHCLFDSAVAKNKMGP